MFNWIHESLDQELPNLPDYQSGGPQAAIPDWTFTLIHMHK